MDFYTLTYLQEQNNVAQFVQYGIVVIIFLVLIVATILYIKDKFQTKYRDLSIIMALILLFMAGINFTEYQNGRDTRVQAAEATTFLKSISEEYHVKKDQVAINARGLSDGIIVKINKKFYKVNLSSDQTNYVLVRTHLINQKVKIHYLPIIIKFVLGLLVFILQINPTGKGNLAPSTALDAVQNYVLGGIIGGVIYNENITILQFVMVLIVWTIIVLTLKFFKDHNRFIRNIIDGQPVTLIKNGKIRVEECLKHGISANDLMFKLRNKGIYEVAKVKSGILEQNGQLTVIEFSDKDHVRYPLISDGQLNVDVLELINQDEEWLIGKLNKIGYKDLSEIYIAEYVNGDLRIVSYPK